MLGINAKFSPYRMILSRREPVQLKVELANTGKETEMASLEIKIGSRLSLDRVGYKTSDIKRIDSIKPNETKTFYFDIWPKNAAKTSEEPVRIRAIEHDGNYNNAKNEFTAAMALKIE